MISSARLGDKHACPLPGHGTTPIASASDDVNINGMGAARGGYLRVWCGHHYRLSFHSGEWPSYGPPRKPHQSRWDNRHRLRQCGWRLRHGRRWWRDPY
ncbi:PAAR domain-containing protein [Pseudomonas amygdali pv. morsprunorum]|nr:PAAR domain-containing protein [Pseudomonas amygdali pv. morsprunorum]